MADEKLEVHPSTRVELMKKKIEDMGLSEAEARIIDAVDGLMHSRFEDFEESIKPFFVQMVGDHLDAISDGLNQFLIVLEKDTVTPKELDASMKKLMSVVESSSIEEMKQFTPEQLQALHNSIVVPLKAHVKEGIVSVNRNINDSYDGLVSQTKLLAQQLADRIRDSKIEIKEAVSGVRAKIDGIGGKRIFQ